MSTRSTISILCPEEGSVFEVYCHFDGYLSGVGQTLLDNWTDYVRGADLILNFGDIRALGPTLEESVFYHRDRDEDLIPPKFYRTLEEWKSNSRSKQEYNYILIMCEGRPTWHILNNGGNLDSLEERLAEETRMR